MSTSVIKTRPGSLDSLSLDLDLHLGSSLPHIHLGLHHHSIPRTIPIMLEDHPDVLETDPHLFSPLVIPSDRPRRTNFLLGQETNITPRSDGETDNLTEPDEYVVDRFEKAVG